MGISSHTDPVIPKERLDGSSERGRSIFLTAVLGALCALTLHPCLTPGACAATTARAGRAASAPGRPTAWNQWRGPTRDGTTAAFSAPRYWPRQLTRRWKVEVGSG